VHDRVAFLVKITTNVALNVAVSARFRREISPSGELPERVPADLERVLLDDCCARARGA